MQTTFSGKQSVIVARNILPVTAALVLQLEALFPPIEVTPTTSQNDIMFDAGRQALIKYLRQENANNAQRT